MPPRLVNFRLLAPSPHSTDTIVGADTSRGHLQILDLQSPKDLPIHLWVMTLTSAWPGGEPGKGMMSDRHTGCHLSVSRARDQPRKQDRGKNAKQSWAVDRPADSSPAGSDLTAPQTSSDFTGCEVVQSELMVHPDLGCKPEAQNFVATKPPVMATIYKRAQWFFFHN